MITAHCVLPAVLALIAMLAPAGTPRPVIAKISAALIRLVHTPEACAQFELAGNDPVGSTPGEFAAFLRRDSEKYSRIVKLSGAKVY
jgi:tripartite-type tricarboxylate transporter receptor subunit TctC